MTAPRTRQADVSEPAGAGATPDESAEYPASFVADMVQLADQQGVPVEPWLTGLGLTRAQIGDATVRISYRQVCLIIKRALRAFRQGDLGLKVGASETIGNFGILGHAMMTARTLGDAIRIGIDYAALTGALLDLEVEFLAGGNVAVVAWPRIPDEEILVFLCEEFFASTLVLVRNLVGAAFRPARLELTYQAPRHASAYRKLFGCDVRFAAKRNQVVVEHHWLEKRLPMHHPVSARQALAICREQMGQVSRQSEIVASVGRILRQLLPSRPTARAVAGVLNISERTLRRQLSAAGCVYRDIHDKMRTERAIELLTAGAMSIADIGAEVGFSDAREFRRAFRRWTGVPPTAMRRPAEVPGAPST